MRQIPCVAICAAVVACAGLRAAAPPAAETPAGFKIGVCDWTIGKRADPDSLRAAKALGLDGVQVDFGDPAKDGASLPLFNAELQQAFRTAVKEQGLEIASLALGTLNSYPLKSDPRAEGWVAQAIEVARSMKVSVILLAFFGNGDLRNDEAGTTAVVETLKRLAPKAEQAGVVLAIESWLSAPQLAAMLKRIGSPAVKVYYDVGNTTKMGYDNAREIKELGRTAVCEVHAKDYANTFGSGEVDFPRVRQALDGIGYRGWIVIESVKLPHGRDETIRRDGSYLRTVFPPR